MPRDLPIGNGSLLVNFDLAYNLRDLYFPHVGQENQTGGRPSRVGLWVDGRFTWLSDDGWRREMRYEPDTLVSRVCCTHGGLGLEVVCHDAVDYRCNVLVRHVQVRDLSSMERQVRLFFHFDFCVGDSSFANTVYYDGARTALIHYRGRRYFLMGSRPAPAQFACGLKGVHGLEGTWRDAEDGWLEGNAIASGSVDSTLAVYLTVPAGGTAEAYQWTAAGHTLADVSALHETVQQLEPQRLLDRTRGYWQFWVRRRALDFGDLSPAIADLYRRSLLIIRTQIDNGGAIMAANDSDIRAFGWDTYSYVWPRDAAIVVCALDEAGYHELTRTFFEFCLRLLEESNYALNGYFMHRYTPSGQVASSWHPSVGGDGLQLPIQEDETALIIDALWKHYRHTGCAELMRELYEGMVRPAGDFLLVFRDHETGLPQPCYDLWEEKHGVFLFTCATVYAGLQAAANFAQEFGDTAPAHEYRSGAEEIQQGVKRYMYHQEAGRYVYRLYPDQGGQLQPDLLLDSSVAAAFIYGLLEADDPPFVRTMEAVQAALYGRAPVGGMARHENNGYYHVDGNYARYPGNPWLVNTLWLADWIIARARRRGDLAAARDFLEWTAMRALPSGVLAEQLHPDTGAPLSVSPLTWSHAAFVSTVLQYLEKRCRLSDGS